MWLLQVLPRQVQAQLQKRPQGPQVLLQVQPQV